MKKHFLIFSLIIVVALSFNFKVYAYGNPDNTLYIEQYDNYLVNLKGTLFNEDAVKTYLGNSNYDSLINYIDNSGYSHYLCDFSLNVSDYSYSNAIYCFFSNDKEDLLNSFGFYIDNQYSDKYLRFFSKFSTNNIYSTFVLFEDNVLSFSSMTQATGSGFTNLANYNVRDNSYSSFQFKTFITNLDNFKVQTLGTYNCGISFKVDNEQYYINNGDTLIYRNNGEGYLNTNDYDVYGPPRDSEFPLEGYKKVLITQEYLYANISGITSGRVYIGRGNQEMYTPWVGYREVIDGQVSDVATPINFKYAYDNEGLEYVYYDFDLSVNENYKFISVFKVGQASQYNFEDVFLPIWVPDDAYVTFTTPVENEQGGNDFDFEWKDPDTGEINTDSDSTSSTADNVVGRFFDNLLDGIKDFNNKLSYLFQLFNAWYIEIPNQVKILFLVGLSFAIIFIIIEFMK